MPRRDRVPRRRDGARKWYELTRHERAVLGELYGRPSGATAPDLAVATGLSGRQLTEVLDALSDATRCAPLGALAVGRLAPGRDDAPEVRYGVTDAWCRTHRTGIAPKDAPVRLAA